MFSSQAVKTGAVAVISATLIGFASPAPAAQANVIDSAASSAISTGSSLLGLGISYAFWGTVYNFARSQAWIINVPVAPGLPNFDRP